MGYSNNVAPGRLLLLLLLAALTCPVASLAASSELEQALAAIEDCMAAAPAAWPQAWCVEYVDAIREASTVCEEPSDYDLRLHALREGFPLYWEGVKTSRDRVLFEGSFFAFSLIFLKGASTSGGGVRHRNS